MNKKISELPAATVPLSGAELMEIVQGGINKQVAKSDVATGGGGATSGSGTTVVGTAVNLGGGLTADADIISNGFSVFVEGTGTDIPQLGTRAVAGIRQAWTMQRGSLPAWEWHLETGADADLHLEAFDDAGVFAFHAIGVDRSTGLVSFPVGIVFVPVGNIAATTVHGALAELDTETTNGRAPVDTTGTAISFAFPQTYGSTGTPETGNVTLVTTGLVKGCVQLLLHNHATTEPTWPTEFKRQGGVYVPAALNSIYMDPVSTTRINYWITQDIV